MRDTSAQHPHSNLVTTRLKLMLNALIVKCSCHSPNSTQLIWEANCERVFFLRFVADQMQILFSFGIRFIRYQCVRCVDNQIHSCALSTEIRRFSLFPCNRCDRPSHAHFSSFVMKCRFSVFVFIPVRAVQSSCFSVNKDNEFMLVARLPSTPISIRFMKIKIIELC